MGLLINIPNALLLLALLLLNYCMFLLSNLSANVSVGAPAEMEGAPNQIETTILSIMAFNINIIFTYGLW